MPQPGAAFLTPFDDAAPPQREEDDDLFLKLLPYACASATPRPRPPRRPSKKPVSRAAGRADIKARGQLRTRRFRTLGRTELVDVRAGRGAAARRRGP